MANCAPPAPDAPREPPASDHARVSASASAASHMGMSEGEGGEVDAMLQLLRSLDAIMPVANRVYVEAYTESGHVYYWHVTEQRSSWSTPEGFEPLRSLAAKLALKFKVQLCDASVSVSVPAGAEHVEESTQEERRRRVSVAAALLGDDALNLPSRRVLRALTAHAHAEHEDDDSDNEEESSASSSPSVERSRLDVEESADYKNEEEEEALQFDEPDTAQNVEVDTESGVVRAATFVKLVEHLTAPHADTKLAQDLMLTYRSLCAPRTLLRALLARVRTATGKDAAVVQLRALNIVRLWLDVHGVDFVRERDVLEPLLRAFAAEVGREPAYAALVKPVEAIVSKLDMRLQQAAHADAADVAALSVSASPRKSQAWPAPQWNATPAALRALEGDEVLAVLSVDPQELARQLTVMEWALWARVQPSELLDLEWTKADTKHMRAPHVVALIEHFNQVSALVQCAVLRAPSPKERSRVVARWLEVCAHLRALHNFNGMLELVSALNTAAVHRLKVTFAQLSKKEQSALSEASALVASADNYKALRHALSALQPPCLPYLGMYLTDLVFLEEGNKNVTRAGLLNFHKRRLVAAVVREVQQYQHDAYALVPLPEVQHALQRAITAAAALPDARRYELSLCLEPRTATVAPTWTPTPSPPELFDSKLLEKALRAGAAKATLSSSASSSALLGGKERDKEKRLTVQLSPRRTLSAAPPPTALTAARHAHDADTDAPPRGGSVGAADLTAHPHAAHTAPADAAPSTPHAVVRASSSSALVLAAAAEPSPRASSSAGTASVWAPPLAYTAQLPSDARLSRRLRRELVAHGLCASDREAAALRHASLATLLPPAVSDLGDAGEARLRERVACVLETLRSAVEELEREYVAPLQAEQLLSAAQVESIFGGVSELAVVLAALPSAREASSSLTALCTELRVRVWPLLAAYVSRFEAAQATLSECAKQSALLAWLAARRALHTAPPRSLREIRAAPLAALLPLLLSLLTAAPLLTLASERALLQETVATLAPIALDADALAQRVLFMARLVEIARGAQNMPRKLLDEKLAQQYTRFFRRECVLVDSPRLGAGVRCYAHVFAGFVLLLSDPQKLKFVEHIALSAASSVTLDAKDARRVSFTANFAKHAQGAHYVVTCPDEATARAWLADLCDARPEETDSTDTNSYDSMDKSRDKAKEKVKKKDKDKEKEKEKSKRRTLLLKK